MSWVPAEVGQSARLEVPVTNVGTARAHAKARVEGPYTIAASQLDVAVGATVSIAVHWHPIDFTDTTGTLVLTTDRQTLAVTLDGSVSQDVDGDGYTTIADGGTDCDDDDASVHPDAVEVCNGKDDDCNGIVDLDAADPPTWYRDDDGDGYGLDDVSYTSCQRPPGFATTGGDCDDTRADIHPGATERWYDGVDQNCDGKDDFDRDGDGYDDAGYGGTDCVDSNATIHPGATEVWYDGVDQNCDGADDYDQDGDGHDVEPRGDDCDDTDDTVYTGAVEVIDGQDNDCDGLVDETG